MPDAFTICETCDVPIPDGEPARIIHDPYTCDRYLGVACRCDGWGCLTCHPVEPCSPLQTALLLAREDVRVRAEAAEIEAEKEAS